MSLETIVNNLPKTVDAGDRLSQLSPKQLHFIHNSYKRINIAHGGVGGGKNFAINLRLIPYFLREPIDRTEALFGFLGETKAVVERNVFSDLKMVIGESNFKFNHQSGSGTIFNKPFHVFDYQNKKSLVKLRGANLRGLMVTEAIFCPEKVWDEGIKRVRVDNEKEDSYAKIFADTNPGNQYHYLNKKFISIIHEQIFTEHFTYRDNLSLSQSFIKLLLSLYPKGTLKNSRYIEGQWVAGEGLVFDCFMPDRHVVKPGQIPYMKFQRTIIGIDYGTVNPTCFIKIGFDGLNFWVWDEYYYDSLAHMQQKTNKKYTIALAAFLKGSIYPFIYIDPSAQSLELEINETLEEIMHKLKIQTNGFMVDHAINDFHHGVDILNVLLSLDRIKISENCTNLIEQISGLVWDVEKAIKTGEELPVKGVPNHATDAWRYGIVSYMLNFIGDIQDIYIEAGINYNDKLKHM